LLCSADKKSEKTLFKLALIFEKLDQNVFPYKIPLAALTQWLILPKMKNLLDVKNLL